MMSDASNQPNPSPTPEPTETEQQTTEKVAEQTTTEQVADKSLLTKEGADEPALYDPDKLTLPEGFQKNESFSTFNEWAKENGLKHEAAQKLIDLYATTAKSNAEAQAQVWREQNEKWQGEVKADKEVGGENLKGVLQTISKVVDNSDLTDPQFREALDFTGAGNHPAIVRTLARWAKALSEGAPVTGGPPNQTQRPRDAGEAIYGSSGPRTGNPRMES